MEGSLPLPWCPRATVTNGHTFGGLKQTVIDYLPVLESRNLKVLLRAPSLSTETLRENLSTLLVLVVAGFLGLWP